VREDSKGVWRASHELLHAQGVTTTVNKSHPV
jgi:hypothetical protein